MVQSLDDARRRSHAGSPGRVPPNNLQAEESLLGAMLLSRDAIAAAVETCSADDFYKPAHGHVFDAVCSLYAQGEPADPVTVADELRRADLLDAIGGPATLITLQANTPATTNAGRYARIVEEHALLRRLIGVAGEIAEIGYGVPEDVAAAVDRAETLVFEVAERRVTDSLRPLHDLLSESLDRLEALYDRGESITGVPTGFIDLDERLSGLQPSSLVIVGARPSMGKTAMALGMAAHAAMEARTPVLFFSLEMSHSEVTQRLLCSEARVDSTRIRNGKLLESDWPKISHAIGRLGEAPLYIDDNPNLTVMEIRAKARRLRSRLGNLGLIVVDYLQLMSGRHSAENRQVEVSEISRGLKILARELAVPVVALSQLSRNLEMRADKRPVLADLRESGCMPATTRILRADNGEEITLGDLVLTQEQPLVWSLDDRWRLVPRRLVKAFSSGIKPVFRLRLASGLEVDSTANHRFRTVDGWTRLDELTPGDHVAVPRRIPAPTTVSEWQDDELILPAHLLGDGSIGPDGVKYATTDPVNKEAVEGAAERLFGIRAQAQTRGLDALPIPERVEILATRTPDPNGDLVAWQGSSAVKAALIASRVTQRRLAERLGGGYCGSHLLGNTHRPRRFSRAGLANIVALTDSTQLAELAGSDVLWDRVVAVTALGDMPTFDATVEGTHNFIAEGVVAHNSLEQDADVVMFLYRDEVYNSESPDRGTAEVIISKHRNGPTGITHLAFLDHYTRFANMARV